MLRTVKCTVRGSKFGHVVEQNNLRFIPAVLSQTGQIYGEFKILVKEQIRHKLILISFEGEAKSSLKS